MLADWILASASISTGLSCYILCGAEVCSRVRSGLLMLRFHLGEVTTFCSGLVIITMYKVK